MISISRAPSTLEAGLIAAALLAGACRGGGGGGTATPSGSAATASATSIAGEYACTYEGDQQAPTVVYQFRDDGSFTIHSLDPKADNTTGRWSVHGSAGLLAAKGQERRFTMEKPTGSPRPEARPGPVLAFTENPPPDWFVVSYEPPASVTGFFCFPVIVPT
jgi:hypothetical protein